MRDEDSISKELVRERRRVFRLKTKEREREASVLLDKLRLRRMRRYITHKGARQGSMREAGK